MHLGKRAYSNRFMSRRRKRRIGEPSRADLRVIVDEIIKSDARPSFESQVVQLVIEKYPYLIAYKSELYDLAKSLLPFT